MIDAKLQKMSVSTNNSMYIGISGFESRITQDFDYIRSLFQKKGLKSLNLLYRASENGYLAQEFHKKCDTITNTLTLVETEYGKVIGGYTPLAWSSTKKNWAADKTL
jgi:TLD